MSDSELDREDDTASVASEGHPEEIEEPEDLVSLNVQSKQDFKRVFRTLNVNFGNYFETQRVNRPYCNNPKGNIPLLVLDVGEDPSWFNPEGGYFKNSNGTSFVYCNFISLCLIYCLSIRNIPFFKCT